ncbi:MAG: ATP-binding cassette domain-containing protein [Bacteroidales bacterium]|nr:ATP-binding cassette domain-containing protein [Bacteroidales bacterium]
MWESLEQASAKEFVEKLPQGIDTLLGDKGVKLSGGEKQRIVLARTLLRRPELLVLDEATSSLDNENINKIQEVIESFRGKITIVIIAHHLSTINMADYVIALDNGKITNPDYYLNRCE